MGILDDAIREHLDLKRQRGADPTEMERLEREALGPVRRGPEGLDDLPPGAEVEASPFDAGDEQDPEWPEQSAEEALLPEPEPPAPDEPDLGLASPEGGPALFDHEADTEAPREPAAPPSTPEPAGAGPADAPVSPDPAVAPPAPEPSPPDPSTELPPPEPSSAPPDHLEEETAEYDVEAEHAQERGGTDRPGGEPHPGTGNADEDVLEETPEFLQDAPDHDRLWFEQRPPKDFDFDE